MNLSTYRRKKLSARKHRCVRTHTGGESQLDQQGQSISAAHRERTRHAPRNGRVVQTTTQRRLQAPAKPVRPELCTQRKEIPKNEGQIRGFSKTPKRSIRHQQATGNRGDSLGRKTRGVCHGQPTKTSREQRGGNHRNVRDTLLPTSL